MKEKNGLSENDIKEMEENNKTKRGRMREFFIFRRLKQSEIIAITFFLFMAMMTGGRGAFLMLLSTEEIERSPMYQSLEIYAPMEIYGIILIVLSLILVVATLIPREPNFYISSFATFFLAIVFILLGMASWEHGASVWNTYLNMLVSVFNGVLTALGGYYILWKKNSNNM